MDQVKFWDALDYLGVLAYFPLSKESDPSERDLMTGWDKWCSRLDNLSRANNGKGVLFVEIGYNTSARAAAEPWAFQTGGKNAEEIQRRCVEAALKLPARMQCLRGMFWWKWVPELPHDEEENYRMQTPELKALLARYWKS